MGSLNSILNIATQSLAAQEEALSVTNNNISNANTAGYSRQIVSLTQSAPLQTATISLGTGVTVQGVSSVQDQFLTLAIQQQTSSQGSANAQVNTLNEIQTLFPTSGSGLSSALSTFYSSLSALSSSPSNATDRQAVISGAQALAAQFNSTASGLSTPIASLNTQVSADVKQINALLSQVASLNSQISQQAPGQASGTLTDQLNQAETQLSGLVNISVIQNANGTANITTSNGTALVLNDQALPLSTTLSGGNVQVLDSHGNNITSAITGGDLGGTLQVRDTDIPELQTSLDTLANQVATSFNTAQTSGYDASGNAGTALFNVSSTVSGSAASISVATTDPNAIAASSDGTSGSNGNVANLLALQTTATTGASNLVYQVGTLASNASAQVTSTGTTLTSLGNQLSSVSGVSIDEETANLVRYQQAYQASAKVIATIAQLFTTTLNMVPNG